MSSWLTSTEQQEQVVALRTLLELRRAVEDERARLDQATFDVFLQRTAGVNVGFAINALDDLFAFYSDYVAARKTLDHYLESVDVVTAWASDPMQPPSPLPQMSEEPALDVESAGVAPSIATPQITRKPDASGPVFGGAAADAEVLRADMRPAIADVVRRLSGSGIRLPAGASDAEQWFGRVVDPKAGARRDR